MLQFTNEIAEMVSAELGDNYCVGINDITKSGDVELLALTIKKGDEKIASSIYINDFYEEYVNGEITKENIVSSVVSVYANSGCELDVDEIFTRINKENIVPILLNKETNIKYLGDKVTYEHPQLENICVAFQIVVDETSEDRKTITVTKELKEKYFGDLTEQDMYEIALKNTDFRLKSLEQVMEELLYGKNCDYTDACNVKLENDMVYVLTNGNGVNGASSILNIDKMKQIEEENGAFYILPSSIHECLLVGQNGFEANALKQMVQEVNSSDVRPEEQLDDTVYIFENGEFRTVA